MGHFGVPSTSKSVHQRTTGVPTSGTEIDSTSVTNVSIELGVDLSASDVSHITGNITSFIKSVLILARKYQKVGRRKALTSEDIESALAFHGISSQLGYEHPELALFRAVGKAGKDIFVREDPEIDLSSFINTPPPKLPLEPHIRSHWLVISGVQPAIPENPVVPVVLPKKAVDEAVEEVEEERLGGRYNSSKNSLFLNQIARTLRKTEQVQMKSMTTHAISLEQQVFFKEITETIMGNSEEKRKEALQYLQMDTGLNCLLPRFSVAVVEGVRCNIAMRNFLILSYLMRIVQALANNPHVSLERCMHDIIPSVMSCILTRQLSDNMQSDSHWKLREFSSRLLATLVKSSSACQILPRVTRILSRVFYEHNCPMVTLYGALHALYELGFETIRSVIVPNVQLIYLTLQKVRSNKNLPLEGPAVDRICTFLATKVLVQFAQDSRNQLEFCSLDDFRRHFSGFGEEVYRNCYAAAAAGNSVPPSNMISYKSRDVSY